VVTCEFTRFEDYPAAEWVLRFENAGAADTPVLSNIQALDLVLGPPLPGDVPFRLHRTNGAPANPRDFEMSTLPITDPQGRTLSGGGGRSSNKDFPFFRLDTARGAAILAVGWSGQWKAEFKVQPDGNLRLTGGMERTHFKLHPGEKVRSPRMLLFLWEGDPEDSHSSFRRLILNQYVPKFRGETPLPILFCNTCFTRGGGWLNECHEQNQISLIRALHPLGVQSVITDAGWFTGGWPNGAGNWDADQAKYPRGMGPVAAAAKELGMSYGLWFEPERVVAGTAAHREHPEWVLFPKRDKNTGLLDFGRPEVQDYFFNIVEIGRAHV
jgi:alpha-galactosidase